MNSTVYVVNVAGHDYTLAHEYGNVTPLTSGYIARVAHDRMLYLVAEGLANSRATDWLLPAGLIPLNMMASVVWWAKHGSLRLLLWVPPRKGVPGRYRPFELTGERLLSLEGNLLASVGDGQWREGE